MATTPITRITRILVIDDHPIVRCGLSQLVSEEPGFEICGEASDASEAIDLVREKNPDLILVDISLGATGGIELIKQIKAMNPEIKMLVVSMHDEKLYAERALRAGAMGYINKQQVATGIIKAIRQVLRGRVYVSPEMAERMLHRVVEGRHEVEQSPIDTLSDRELEVFELIGRGLTTGEIAKKLHLSTKTIETHRENIKTKLNLRNANELIRRAVQWTMEQDGTN